MACCLRWQAPCLNKICAETMHRSAAAFLAGRNRVLCAGKADLWQTRRLRSVAKTIPPGRFAAGCLRSFRGFPSPRKLCRQTTLRFAKSFCSCRHPSLCHVCGTRDMPFGTPLRLLNISTKLRQRRICCLKIWQQGRTAGQSAEKCTRVLAPCVRPCPLICKAIFRASKSGTARRPILIA